MSPRYVPALGHDLLTGLYDPVVRWTTREAQFKDAMLQASELRSGDRVLDVACGTGTLAIAAARAGPVDVCALDGDPRVLGIARSKAARDGVSISWQLGDARRLPYAGARFDCVFNSLFLHHLEPADKLRALAEMRRVLRPGGRLVLADWDRPRTAFARASFLAVRVLDGFRVTAGHAQGKVAEWIRDAGFAPPEEVAAFDTFWGTLRIHRALPSAQSAA
jgi:ubiquinone/menaquinone biosynthesis C-methylase UbiE